MKKFRGFTLSELMVALAVIGILVAIVTPAIFKNRPNKNKMMVKKSFYIVEQVVSTMINDDNMYPDMRSNCGSNYTEETSGVTVTDDKKCYWGFDDTRKVNYEGEDASGTDKFYKLFKNRINYKSEDSTNHVFYTSDGVKWDLSGTINAWKSHKKKVGTFDDSSPEAGKGIIKIDVNGNDAPNKRCASGVEDCDQYNVEILANGKLRIDPADVKALEYVTINTSIRDSQ